MHVGDNSAIMSKSKLSCFRDKSFPKEAFASQKIAVELGRAAKRSHCYTRAPQPLFRFPPSKWRCLVNARHRSSGIAPFARRFYERIKDVFYHSSFYLIRVPMQRKVEETNEDVGEHERSKVEPNVHLRRNQEARAEEKGVGSNRVGLREVRHERFSRRSDTGTGDSSSRRGARVASADWPRGTPTYWVCESAR